MSCRPLQRRGAVHIWVAILLVVLIGFTGLALDTGYGVLVGNQLQNAADAGALAAAREVRSAPSNVRGLAVAITGQNRAGRLPVNIDADNDVIIGTFDTATRTFVQGGTSPNAVRVTAHRTEGSPDGGVPLSFGPLFGTNSADVTRTATAMAIGPDFPALLVLHPSSRCALTVSGSATLTVTGGPVHVNSSNPSCAACIGGNSEVHASALNTFGQACINGGTLLDTTVNTGVAPYPDPFAALPAPPIGSPLGSITVGTGQTVTLAPGNYSGGLTIRGTAILSQGVYVVGGTGLKLNSGAVLEADGVMFYIAAGGMSVSSGVDFSLLAPDPTRHSFVGVDTYAGISIFQARTNNSTATLSMSGNIALDGVYYFPNAALNITSSGSRSGARFIASELKFTGSGEIIIDYHAPSPSDSPTYLVE